LKFKVKVIRIIGSNLCFGIGTENVLNKIGNTHKDYLNFWYDNRFLHENGVSKKV